MTGTGAPTPVRGRAVRSLGALVALTLVTVTISESIFWGQPRQAYGDPLGLVGTVLAYGVLVTAVLGLVQRLAPATWLGVFVAGALLGWGVEGVVVATTYEALPWSISFTALAWHALISVGWGWVLLPRWLGWGRRGLVRMLVAGALWGMWGAWMGIDSGEHARLIDFAAYALVAGLVLGSGVVGWSRWRPAVVGTRLLVGCLGLIGLVAVVRVVSLPWAPLVLGPLLAAGVWALRRLPHGQSLVAVEPAPRAGQVVAGMVAMVVGAVAAYAVAAASSVPEGFGPAVYVVTTATGFVLLGRALWLAWRGERPTAVAAD